MNKNPRQEKILEIVQSRDVTTQEELTRLVREAGFEATQATCSRDIKKLGIIKITLPGGNTKYVALERSGDVTPGRLLSVFTNSLISVNDAMNIVVIKTLPGMAQAAASALDSMHFADVVGTIAGDDTIFVATAGIDEAKALVTTLREMS